MISLIRDMSQDALGRIMLAMMAITVAMLLSIPYWIIRGVEEQKQWEAFAAEHDCRVVSVVPGVTTMTAMMVGKSLVLVPQTHPDRTTYLCNDERTYTR